MVTRLSAVALLAAAALLPAPAAQAWTLTTLYSFTGGTDGSYPAAGVLYQDGMLYGTTFAGGAGTCPAGGCGTVFAVNATTGAETVLHRFGVGTDGAIPFAGLTHHAGLLSGTTDGGGALGAGANGRGTVFKLNPKTGRVTVLHSFAGGTDGAGPVAGLIYVNGTLYGTTSGGGCCGVVFQVDLATGAEAVIHSFAGLDGRSPQAPLIARNGILYGTTAGGGSDWGVGNGTVFKLDTATGTETVLYSFKGPRHDGATSRAGLLYLNGALYGTTESGNPIENGTVFKVDATTGVETILHNFKGQRVDGRRPDTGLVYLNGSLYGTTRLGGTKDKGTVFALDLATGTETVLHSFTGPDGNGPSPLIYQGGAFYGTTSAGGGNKACRSTGCGTVFKLTP